MTERQLIAARLTAQHLTASLSTPAAVVRSMCAMQGQDLHMSFLAVAIRSKKPKSVIGAFNKGTILRTHALRPTWQLVSSQDIRWLLQISAPNIRRAAASRHRQLKLDDRTISKALSVIECALAKEHQSRETLMAHLRDAGIRTDENRSSHILLEAEIVGLICSGAMNGRGHFYDLLERRVKKVKPVSEKQALKRLALAYFKTRGPATIADLTWWSGLNAAQVRVAMKEAKSGLKEIDVNGKTCFVRSVKDGGKVAPILLLPSYDEWLISYKDRSAVITSSHHKRAVSVNGIFNPIVLQNGKVAGTWRTGKGAGISSFTKSKVLGAKAEYEKMVKLLSSIIPGKAK